jgi:hypothetical protein
MDGLVLKFLVLVRDRTTGDDEMTEETMKALVMLAMFGILEFALYFPRIREVTKRLRKDVPSLLMPIATPVR